MTNNDLNQISKLLDEKLIATEKSLERKLDEKLTVTEKRLRSEIVATEKRLKAEIADSGENIIEEIAGFMEINIIPKLEGKVAKSDIEKAGRRLDYVSDRIGEHDVRIKDIEAIPVIAHQLKIRKTK